MSSAFVIEIHSHAAGIVVRDGRHFRFYAASDEFSGLEGRDFSSPTDAQKAVVGYAAMLEGKKNVARAEKVRHDAH